MTFRINYIRSVFFLLVFSCTLFSSFGQRVNIFELMERRDLRLQEIENIAKRHFNEVGRVRGTGYKQYERWKFEMQFHLDENGYILPANYDGLQYQTASASLATLAAPGTWKEMGPTKWNRTSGWNPGVGRITSISVHPLDTNLIYVTSPGGGIWKTTVGGGNNWTPLGDKTSNMMNMFAVAVDPINTSIVLSGNNGGNIFKSIDAGSTWTTVGTSMGTIRKILFDPTNSNTIWAATTTGIYKSVNAGSNWTRIITTSIEDIEFQPGNTTVMYASGSNVFRSADGGSTWTQLGITQGITNSGRTLISVSPNDPLVVYAVQANGSEFGRMYKSTDGGLTFVTTVTGSAANGTNYFGYSTNGTGTGGQASYDMAMTVNPENANEVYIAGIIVWRSTNGGTSFTANTAWSLPNSTGYNHADVHVLEWIKKTIYSGSDGGIYKKYSLSSGSTSWVDLSSGLGIRQFYRIAAPKTGKTVVTGGAQDNGTSIVKSGVWYDWLGADGMDCIFSPLDSNLVWGTSQYGSLYKSTNGGASYSGVANPVSGNWVTPIAIESNSNIIYGGWDGVYKSTDQGNTWTKISGTTITSLLNTVAIAPSNPQYIYASVGGTLYVTKDGGTSWTTIAAGNTISQIAIHPTNPEKIWIAYAASSNQVVVSTDAGVTRTPISSGLPSISARSVAVDPLDESIYVGMNIGVYFKAASSSSWVNVTDNLPLVAINEIELHPATRMVRLGTYGRGLWEMPMINGCIAPTAATASNLTYNSATVSWDGLGGSTGFTVEYKKSADANWTVQSTNYSSNNIVLSGLQENTSYDFRVSTACQTTPTLITTTFTTATFVCPSATGLATSNITTSSATLSWTALTNVANYTVEYKLSTELNWTVATASTTGTSLTLNGLLSGSTYNWRVTPNCTISVTSGTSATATFTTTFVCNAPANNQVTNITGTTATISWNPMPGATGYDVDYKRTSSTKWTRAATATTATSVNLSGLTAASTYDYRIRTFCGSTIGYSGYVQAQFQTITTCTDNYESNNTASTAKSISLNTELTALINISGDLDWYKFVTPNTGGGNIRITVYNLPANYDVILYNATGTTLLSSSVLAGTSSETIIRNSAGNKTTYMIQIKGASASDFNGSQCYRFKIETSATAFPLIAPSTFNTFSENNQSSQLTLQEIKWKLYPIPAHGMVNLSFNSQMNVKGECILTDMQGRVVLNKVINIMNGFNLQQLNVDHLLPGVYFIKLTGMNRPIVDKIIIH